MIEGLKLDFSAEELDQHLAKRFAYHNERVEFYETQVVALRKGLAEAQSYTNGDPVRNLTEAANKHRVLAEKAQLIREHLVGGEYYRLNDKDLMDLELLTRGW